MEQNAIGRDRKVLTQRLLSNLFHALLFQAISQAQFSKAICIKTGDKRESIWKGFFSYRKSYRKVIQDLTTDFKKQSHCESECSGVFMCETTGATLFLNRSWLENRCWRACGDECTGVFKKDLIKESQPCLQSVSLQIYVSISAHLAHN